MENENKEATFSNKESRDRYKSIKGENEDDKKINWKKEVVDFIKVVVIALVITNILNVFVFTLSQVKQSSMETTLIGGDQLVVEKVSYSLVLPKRNDIVVIIKELSVDTSVPAKFVRLYQDMFAKITGKEGHFRLVKRVVGLPGEEIDIRDGKVYINGNELEEAFISQPTYPKNDIYPFVIPDGEYFVLGDNRGGSLDSRDFGTVKRELIEGKVWVRFWPLNKMGGIK